MGKNVRLNIRMMGCLVLHCYVIALYSLKIAQPLKKDDRFKK